MIGVGRRKFSEADREAAQARDAALATKAEDALADPNLGGRIAGLLTTPRLLTYSVRNQALLLVQAEEREMPLSHVKTFRQWLVVGRQVRRGEQALRIVKPVSRGNTGEDGGDGEGGGRPMFRTDSVFDISQTDPIEDWDGDVEDEPSKEELDPARALFESLSKQAERAGYLVAVWPEEQRDEPVRVGHDGHTIDVYGEHTAETLGRLAGAVADVITHHRAKAPAEPPDAKPSGRGRAADRELVITVQ